jgi:hypothetical protein
MAQQNRFPESIIATKGTSTSLTASTTYPRAEGQIAYNSTTKQLYVAGSTASGDFRRVLTLNSGLDLDLTNRISTYNNIGTTGWGIPSIYGSGRKDGMTTATSSTTYTVGSADGSFEVSANVLVTTSSAENFTVTCVYTDEGNTSRTLTLNFQTIAGTIGTAINFANGAVPYEGIIIHIRSKASTTITISTTGTFTGATYNIEGVIKQIR